MGLGSHGQVSTIVSRLAGAAVIARQCFLQARHGRRALNVYNGVELRPPRGRLRQWRGGRLGRVRPARVRALLHLHLDVVELP